LRQARPELLAAASGLLLFLSFPKFGHWVFGWIALAPLLLALVEVRGRRALRAGFITGCVSGVGLLYWTALVVRQFGGLPLPAAVAAMLLLAMAVAVLPALFAWIVARWVAGAGLSALWFAPVAWVATEVVRAYTYFYFPWCLLGYSQADNLVFVQVARFGAVYAVSFLLALTSAGLALAFLERDARRRRRILLAVSGVIVLVSLDGAQRLAEPVAEKGRVRVALVQASIPQDEKWDPAKAVSNVRKHVALSERAADAGAKLVVWPESAVPWDVDRNPALLAELRQLTQHRSIELLFGNDDHDLEGDRARSFVGAKRLNAEGALDFRYHKIRLVPFGEYVPLQPLVTLGGRVAAKVVDQVSDFTPGSDYAVGAVGPGRFSASICYEAIFADLFREFAARGAELFVNMTNDAWYGTTSAPYQHFAMARFRAVENGRYLVRAANTGISAVVDPRGRVLEKTALFEPALVVADVPLVAEPTFYTLHGDVFAWACLGATISFTAFVLVGRRRV
jgi:apolipoprotein N-acyltransferase